MGVNVSIDLDDIWDDVTDRELVTEIRRRLKIESRGGRNGLKHLLKEKEVECWAETEGENSLSADNLIDEFKIKAFKEAMEKYSLEEIENRLK